MSISCPVINHRVSPKHCFAVASTFSSLIAFAICGVNEARADRIRASAAPPVFLWTDERPAVAQHVATSISDSFGTVHSLGPGAFVGGFIPPISSINVSSGKEKTVKNGNAFGWTNGVRSNGSNPNSGSSEGNAGGVSSVVHQPSTSIQINGNAGAGAALAVSSILGVTNDSSAAEAAPHIGNPIPPTLVLFGSGLCGLTLLARRRKRINKRHDWENNDPWG